MGDEVPRFGAALWINRTSWPELRGAALAAEAAGWDSVWLDDHLLCDEGGDLDPEAGGLDRACRPRRDHDPGPPGPPRDGGDVPEPRGHRQDGHDAGPRVRGPLRPRARGRLARPRARGLRDRLRFRLRRAARPPRRGRRPAASPARRRGGDASRALLRPGRGGLRTAAGAGPPADPHRGHRPDEDAADGGARGGHLERLRDARAAGRALRRPGGARSRRRARRARHRAPGLRQPRRPVLRAGRRRVLGRVRARHDIQPGEDPLHAGGRPEEVAAALLPYLRAGVDEIVAVLRTPWDRETIDRLPEVRAALRTARG